MGDSGTYLDDVLWPAIVRRSAADAKHMERYAQAAWDTYCEFESSDAKYRALINFVLAAERAKIDSEAVSRLIHNHRGLDRLSPIQRFRLSARQRKELRNGKQLLIALPHPGDVAGPQAVRDWAIAHLDVEPEYVREVREGYVWVHGEHCGDSPVQDAIGTIERRGIYPPLRWQVWVVLVTIRTRPIPRGEYPPQWPRDYTYVSD